jgi:hypothetical protein
MTHGRVMNVPAPVEFYDALHAQVVGPAVASLSGGQAPPAEPVVEEFEPRGLIIPSAAIAD